MSTKLLNTLSADLRGEQRAEPIPPKPYSLMADFDPAFMQQHLQRFEVTMEIGHTSSPQGG